MRKSKAVQVKHLQIGGGAPVVIQSMTKTDTANVAETVAQIEEMVSAGCEIVRLAVPDNDAALALKEIRKRVPEVPLVADIHCHYLNHGGIGHAPHTDCGRPRFHRHHHLVKGLRCSSNCRCLPVARGKG